jgi:hypothetical protein
LSGLSGGRAERPGLTLQIPYCAVPTCGLIRSSSHPGPSAIPRASASSCRPSIISLR